MDLRLPADSAGAFTMTTTITMAIGYVLAGLIAAAIIFVGARFLVAPRVAAAGYGVQPDLGQPSVGAYLSVKGVRDIASGLFVLILMAAGATHLLGWLILAATVIPLADAAIVLRHGGPGSIAWGVHGGTAGLMLVTSALLLL
ncbi:membrane protein [Mycolicibacterium vaccae 95051]|nr:membrane protein [Mycolicibacterium vaccae 95051]